MRLANTCRLAVAALGFTAIVSPALAAGAAEPFQVAFATEGAASACPTESEFVGWVRERLGHAELAQDNPAARRYSVSVQGVGTGFVARLLFQDSSGATRTREVGAETCADVSRAIALVTALAIDAAVVESNDSGSGPAPPMPGSSPAADAVIAPVVAPPPDARGAEAPEDQGQQRAPAPPEGSLGLQGTSSTPKGPSVLLGAELVAGLRDARARWLFELGVAGERGFRASSDAGSATFSFVGGRLRACAFSLALGAGFELWPCSTFEGGAVVAKGYIDNPNTQVDPWFAVGAAIRFGYRAAVGGLHLEVGPVFPILKTHYVFGPVDAPDGTVHDTPAVGLQAALGGSLTIF